MADFTYTRLSASVGDNLDLKDLWQWVSLYLLFEARHFAARHFAAWRGVSDGTGELAISYFFGKSD